ncbi:PilZ domain-containing protein [Planctomycetota bacterium]
MVKDDDRRKYYRINKNIPVRITIPNVDGEGVDAHLASVTRNVSMGGVLIEFAAIREEMWKKLHETGVIITIEMFFPEYDERISVEAEVKWIKEANKLLAQYSSIGLSIIEDEEINPKFPELYKKLREIIQ